MFKISIIIPVYGVEQYIDQCIDSVLNQDYSNIECIIVNDCTKDNSMLILDAKLKEYSGNIDFKIVNQEHNKGLSAARNRGLELSTGDYVYFLDSDDMIFPKSMSLLAKLITRYNEVDVVMGDMECKVKNLNKILTISDKHFLEFSNNPDWIYNHFLINVPVTAVNKLYSKIFLKRGKLRFEEDLLHEDVLWHYCLGKNIQSIAFCFNKTYYYRYNSNSITISALNEKLRIESNFKILNVCLNGIVPHMKGIQNIFILKYFYHIRMLNVSKENKRYFQELFLSYCKYAFFHRDVLGIFKFMYIFLLMPSYMLRFLHFFWQKGIGLLYRVVKRKALIDNTLTE